MKRTITVSSSFSGKIATGQYENASPSFAVSEVVELDVSDQEALAYIQTRQDALQALCAGNFEQEVVKAKIAKIKADRKDFHWYRGVDGDYPSVTSIIGYDSTFHVDDEDLKQFASQGNIIHAQVAEYIKTGVWKEPKDIDGIGADLFIIKTGKLGLALDGWNFEAMVKKFKITDMVNGTHVVSDKHRYGGLPDIPVCKIDGVLTMADIKRTADKVKNFMQMSAYEMARREMGQPPNDQMAILPLNDKTEQGFSKPIISTDIDKYFDLFLYKRREFRKVYGI